MSWFLDFICFSLTYNFHTFYAEQVCVSTKKKSFLQGEERPRRALHTQRAHGHAAGYVEAVLPSLHGSLNVARTQGRAADLAQTSAVPRLVRPHQLNARAAWRLVTAASRRRVTAAGAQLKGVSKLSPLAGHSVGTD